MLMLATSWVELTNCVEFVTTLLLGTPFNAHCACEPTSKPDPNTCTLSVESTVPVSGAVDLTVGPPPAGPPAFLAAEAGCITRGAEGGALSVHAQSARRPTINRRPCERARDSGKRVMTSSWLQPWDELHFY